MTSPQPPDSTLAPSDPAVTATAGLLRHRRAWIWTLLVSLAGFIVATAVDANVATGGVAYVILSVIVLVMLMIFLVSLTMAFVVTSRLRRGAPQAREPALAAHRAEHHPVLAHPHDRRHHPVGYAIGWVLVAGWLVGGVLFLPRVVNCVAYLLGTEGHATFVPRSYGQQCGRSGCSTVTNGALDIGGHASPATWPGQVPLGLPFTVREPAWRWALGSQLTTGTGNAIGNLVVGLIFDGGAVLALVVIAGAGLGWRRERRHAHDEPKALPGAGFSHPGSP